jgi:hypothetical protein
VSGILDAIVTITNFSDDVKVIDSIPPMQHKKPYVYGKLSVM